MSMAASGATRRQELERWPPAASTVFVVAVSLALWSGIYSVTSALYW
jgi:hypothetical protein